MVLVLLRESVELMSCCECSLLLCPLSSHSIPVLLFLSHSHSCSLSPSHKTTYNLCNAEFKFILLAQFLRSNRSHRVCIIGVPPPLQIFVSSSSPLPPRNCGGCFPYTGQFSNLWLPSIHDSVAWNWIFEDVWYPFYIIYFGGNAWAHQEVHSEQWIEVMTSCFLWKITYCWSSLFYLSKSRPTKRIDDTSIIMREILENPPTSGDCTCNCNCNKTLSSTQYWSYICQHTHSETVQIKLKYLYLSTSGSVFVFSLYFCVSLW